MTDGMETELSNNTTINNQQQSIPNNTNNINKLCFNNFNNLTNNSKSPLLNKKNKQMSNLEQQPKLLPQFTNNPPLNSNFLPSF